MTRTGRAYVVNRLTSCPDLAALQRVWSGLGLQVQRDSEIHALKEQLKAQFEVGK